MIRRTLIIVNKRQYKGQMKTIIESFKNNSIFDEFTTDELWQIAGEMRKEIYVSGEKLYETDMPSQKIYILVEGHFMIHFDNGMAFTLTNPGDIIGTEPFLEKQSYLTTCTCLSKKGFCGILSGKKLFDIEKNFPTIKSKLNSTKKEFLSKTKFF